MLASDPSVVAGNSGEVNTLHRVQVLDIHLYQIHIGSPIKLGADFPISFSLKGAQLTLN